MRIFIDGQEAFHSPSPPAGLAAVLQDISRQLCDHGRGMVEILVDGESISPEDLAEFLDRRDTTVIETIEIRTEPLDALVADVIEQMRAVLPQLPDVCHMLAEVFQGETPEDGYPHLGHLAEIWDAIQTYQRQIAESLRLDLRELAYSTNKTVGHHHDKLHGVLGAVAAAIEQRDAVALGDLLEYELAPLAEIEIEILQFFASKIPAADS